MWIKKQMKYVVVLLTALALMMSPMSSFAASRTVARVSAKTAKQIAINKVGGGTVVECRKDNEDGRWEYEITIVKKSWKYELDIRISDGRINDYEAKQMFLLSKTKAKRIAKNKVGGGIIQKCSLRTVSDKIVYKVTLKYKGNKYTMNVAAKNGKVTNYRKNGKSISKAAEVSAERAKKIALDKVGGGTVVKCKREHDDGRMVYDIEIIYNNMEYELEIGVKDGTIYSFEYESVYDD